MNATMAGEKFDPSRVYSITMVSFFIAMTYGPGMPILMAFCMV